MATPNLEWTVMIYFAAPDQALTDVAFGHLDNLQKLGSSDRVHVVGQLDTFTTPTASRFFVKVGGGLDQIDLPVNPNTGAVDDLVDFVKWVKDSGHEAKRYLLVLNGHGNGAEDFPGDESSPFEAVLPQAIALPDFAEKPGVTLELGNAPEALAVASESTGLSAEFVNTAAISASATKMALAIIPDNSPPDALTSRELKEALDQSKDVLGVEKIHIVGMDACLMSMVEIARQISDASALMVASEQTIPTKSWPYREIIEKLEKNPTFEPPELANLIVGEYVAFYEASPDKEQVALSVCDLGKTGELTKAMGDLVKVLQPCLSIKELRLALVKARFSALSFFISDFIDLFDFCSELIGTLEQEPFKASCSEIAALCEEVRKACKAVMQKIRPDVGTGFVAKSAITFPAKSLIAKASGISIYFPLILPIYGELIFSNETQWDEFLKDYMNTFFLHGCQAGSAKSVTSLLNLPLGGNGSNSKGGIEVMKSNAASAPARTPCLVLLKGTSINDKANGITRKLSGLSFLDMTPNPKVNVKDGTKLDIPGEGIKASSGTPLKATPGTQIGVQAPLLEMVVPACTLREVTTGNPPTELSDGTSIVAKSKDSPIIALAEMSVVSPPA